MRWLYMFMHSLAIRITEIYIFVLDLRPVTYIILFELAYYEAHSELILRISFFNNVTLDRDHRQNVT